MKGGGRSACGIVTGNRRAGEEWTCEGWRAECLWHCDG